MRECSALLPVGRAGKIGRESSRQGLVWDFPALESAPGGAAGAGGGGGGGGGACGRGLAALALAALAMTITLFLIARLLRRSFSLNDLYVCVYLYRKASEVSPRSALLRGLLTAPAECLVRDELPIRREREGVCVF